MKKLLTLPNFLTALRIAGAACLLFIAPLSPEFFIVYTFCGISDVLDGVIARASHSTTEFGAKLDSAADLLFYSVMMLRIFPVLWECLPRVIWIYVGLVLALRTASYTTAALKYHRFAALHTYLNKLTGLMVFMTPYFIKTNVGVFYCFAACAVGCLASAEELTIHILRREYRPGVMTIIDLIKADKKAKKAE